MENNFNQLSSSDELYQLRQDEFYDKQSQDYFEQRELSNAH